jgi:hypothetical protein
MISSFYPAGDKDDALMRQLDRANGFQYHVFMPLYFTLSQPGIVASMEYRVGTTSRVKKVATSRPKITTMDMDCHIWEPSLTQEILIVLKLKETPVTMGISPRMVVMAVSMTGRSRVAPAALMASWSSKPLCLNLFV